MPIEAGAGIGFRPLTAGDYPLLSRWLNAPHIREWWGDPDEELGFIRDMVEGRDTTRPYIIELDGAPVGYIQTYPVSAYEDYAQAIDMADEDPWAIDIFIGEDDARGIGLGPRIIKQFVDEHVFSRPEVKVALLNPEPANERGRKCYEKAGFRHVKTVWVPESKAEEYIMRRDRA
jgi:aminoglycoside 6'-N-acetyltransferase